MLLRCRGSASSTSHTPLAASQERNATPRLSLRLPAFYQRIAPLSQRRDVHIDPVVPPIERSRVIFESGALLGRKSFAHTLHVRGFENMIVFENEGLEQSDQLDDSFQISLLPRERRAGKRHRAYCAADQFYDQLLRRRGKLFVAGLGHRDGIEFQSQPVIQ